MHSLRLVNNPYLALDVTVCEYVQALYFGTAGRQQTWPKGGKSTGVVVFPVSDPKPIFSLRE